MELRLIIMALICLCIAQLAFAVEDNYPFTSIPEQQRFIKLIKELRCTECQNQTLFDSNASLAQDMRAQIYAMVKAGDTDSNIRDFLSYRYGDYILFNPPWRAGTLLLWLSPLLLLSLGLWLSLRVYAAPLKTI